MEETINQTKMRSGDVPPRTVKTLLMCKVKPFAVSACSSDQPKELSDTPSYQQIYQNIWSEWKGKKYITIGNSDAVCIYDTASESSDWFKEIYRDKQDIIFNTDREIDYHPIHLVANQKYSDERKEVTDKPFCVVSLIYGIIEPSDSREDDHLSRYEKRIEQFLDELKREENFEFKPEDTEYEIYNAVNICDSVIIWYTKNLWDVLLVADRLTSDGLARKTFTLVGFAMDDRGDISEKAYNVLELLEPDHPFSMRIQGSIRDQSRYRGLLTEIYNAIDPSSADSVQSLSTAAAPPGGKTSGAKPGYTDYIVCGQSDFSVLIPNVNGRKLKQLLEKFLDQVASKNLSVTCWEFHTELMYDELPPSKSHDDSEIGPQQVLNNFYDQCLEITKAFKDSADEDPNYKALFPWYSAFWELLNVHANLDKDPILHGPGYLIYNSVKIILFYLKKLVLEKDPAIQPMLRYSRDQIQDFLRALSTLTDQMMRIDDLVFHGFGNNSALYNTLPECALDFYHAFILKFVDLLIAVDEKDERLGDSRENYLFDFLLLPELDRGISIVPMFDTEELKKSQSDGKNKRKRKLFPRKQAFLVYFPIQTVFSPLEFFPPLMHECFHLLGDACRLRQERAEHICAFFAGLFATQFCCASGAREDQALFAFFYSRLIQSFASSDNLEPDLPETEILLNDGMKQLFTPSVLKTIRTKYSSDVRPFTKEFVRKWVDCKTTMGSQNVFWVKQDLNTDLGFYIKDCLYLFKECYADLMMVLVLGLQSDIYVRLFMEDVTNATAELRRIQLTRAAQRIALVLNACTNYRFTEDLDTAHNSVSRTWTADCIIQFLAEECKGHLPEDFAKTTLACYRVLQSEDAELDSSIEDDIAMKLFPRVCTSYVQDYLKAVKESFEQKYLAEGIRAQLLKLRTEFHEFFISNNFLSKDYFRIIQKCHHDIQEDFRTGSDWKHKEPAE